MEKVDKFLSSWSREKRIGGDSFDDLFQIDGAPLWWFFERMFVSHILPRRINFFYEIEKKTPLRITQMVTARCNAFVLRKMILYNEYRKLRYFKKSRIKQSGRLLFLSYTNHILPDGHLFRIQKIVDEAKRSSVQPFILFADSLSSRNYKQLEGRSTLYDYQSSELEKEAKRTAEKLFTLWDNLGEERKMAVLTKDDFSYWPYLSYAFNVFFSKEFLTLLVYYYEMARSALVKQKIKVVFLSSQNSLFDKCIIAAAQKLEIPILRLQHGIGEGVTPYNPFDNFYKLIFSQYVKADLMKVGWPEDKLIVVGPVIFDEISRYIQPKKIKGKKLLIATAPLVTECGGEQNYFDKIQTLLAGIKKFNDSEVVIKLHPAEIPVQEFKSKYAGCSKKAGVHVHIVGSDVTRGQFYKMIQDCDVFINFGSTTALEAMIIKRPVVTVKMIDFPAMTDWMEKNDIAVVINNTDDIGKAVQKAIDQQEAYSLRCRKYVSEKCGIVDGQAYKRVLQVIRRFWS